MSIIVDPHLDSNAVFPCGKEEIPVDLPHILYYFRKEGMHMEKNGQELTIHCFFTKEGENPQELIFRSLRIFTERNLQNYAFLHDKCKMVQYIQ